MRFGLRASSVSDVNKIGTNLITSRRVIFTPNVEIKDELARTAINITCYDRNGNVVKRITSSDDGTVEDPENPSDNTGGSGSDNTGGSGTDNTGGSGNDNTGGSGSDNTGGSGTDPETPPFS